MSEILLAFKAGRAFRRPDTDFVDPAPDKGAIIVANGEDGLLHFTWKNRTTGNVEEDLILFPSDASFVKVPQASGGRAYVLKFLSSDQRHFFWMQDPSSARDDEFVNNLNGLLENPEFLLQWETTTPPSGSAEVSSSSSSQPQASASTRASSSVVQSAPFQATPEQLGQLAAILRSAGSTRQPPPELSLTDILTPANLTPLFQDHPELISTLFPHLPPDLPVSPSAEVVNRIINSPQFRASLTSFDQALRTGLLGDLVRGLGLPEEAGTGVLPFLRAIQEQANRERDNSDHMETD